MFVIQILYGVSYPKQVIWPLLNQSGMIKMGKNLYGYLTIETNRIHDVTFLDENTCVMDGLGHAIFEDKSLKEVTKEFLHGKREDVIKIYLGLIQEGIHFHTPQ